jgi:hypothetical protein
MASIDSPIDDLYKGSLDSFVPARNALAKSLKGDDAKTVKQLAKPTVVPWTVNQIYWHRRPDYDRVLSTGAALRKAQIAALGGRAGDVRAAAAAHRAAIADAVKAGVQLAEAGGEHPSADAVSRMLEAISLSEQDKDAHGRFTKPIQPAGFEALAGVAVKSSPGAAIAAPAAPAEPAGGRQRGGAAAEAARKAEERERERQQRESAAAERRRQAAIEKAEAKLEEAKAEEARAKRAWEQARERLAAAERALNDIG